MAMVSLAMARRDVMIRQLWRVTDRQSGSGYGKITKYRKVGKIMSAYEWKTGTVYKADPNEVGKQFEELEKTVGITAQTVLDANRAENTPLHNEFEWDDTEAAEKYRLHQASGMIRGICVKVETEEHEEVQVRAVFKTQADSYESLNVILRNEDKRAVLLEQAYKELQAFIKKYEILKELLPIKEAFQKIMG